VPGARAQAPAAKPAPLFEGMGGYRLAGASEVPQAQRYANQGMVLAFGFNPAEAARSFAAATALDPDSAACWWGLAWALGPTITPTPRTRTCRASSRRWRGRPSTPGATPRCAT
jgi:hypothetical protein